MRYGSLVHHPGSASQTATVFSDQKTVSPTMVLDQVHPVDSSWEELAGEHAIDRLLVGVLGLAFRFLHPEGLLPLRRLNRLMRNSQQRQCHHPQSIAKSGGKVPQASILWHGMQLFDGHDRTNWQVPEDCNHRRHIVDVPFLLADFEFRCWCVPELNRSVLSDEGDRAGGSRVDSYRRAAHMVPFSCCCVVIVEVIGVALPGVCFVAFFALLIDRLQVIECNTSRRLSKQVWTSNHRADEEDIIVGGFEDLPIDKATTGQEHPPLFWYVFGPYVPEV